MKLISFSLVILILSVSCSLVNAYDNTVAFAQAAVSQSLNEKAQNLSVDFKIDDSAEDLKAEGFKIVADGDSVTVIGKDAAGVMYGGLDLAETIRSEGVRAIKDKVENPYMQMRGVKFNVPLDVRTPSYSDMSNAGQNNMPEVWSFEFWKEYIDTMASYRYNYISLWSLHPFPSLVKVPEYPEVALDNVMRSTGPYEEYTDLRGIGYDEGPFYENKEVIIEMTIDEKIAFWKKVMAYGKSRNIDFYIITWNIFTYGIEGKYGIDDSPNNETTIDYFRKSVKSLILTYPDLAGIGITTGENMYPDGSGLDEGMKKNPHMSAKDKEAWMVKTYLQGTLDALEAAPDRKIRFIHRQHQTGVDMVLSEMQPLIDHPRVDFIFSFKYAQAHVYSATEQPFHGNFVKAITDKVKTIWTLRNDDIYLFRWASPDFVREFVKNIPYEVSQGYYYGHDGWINGREFTQLDAESPRQLEVKKHWLQWMLWGRFAYNPDYSNERIIAKLSERYPEVDGAKLLDAWQKASLVYPRVTALHWGALDYRWYIEGTTSHPRTARNKTGFRDVDVFIRQSAHNLAGVLSIADFVEGKKAKGKLSPFELADLIESDVTETLDTLKTFGTVSDKELQLTLDDIRIISEMGLYYADKIRGSTYVALARQNKSQADKDKAIQTLTEAAEHYKDFVELVTANHINEIWLNRVGIVNFKKQIDYALHDIEIAKKVELD